MKFESFRIKNIKSIIDSGKCFLSSDNITVLAGQNEAGKSAILESLHFFTNGMNEKFEKYSKNIQKTYWQMREKGVLSHLSTKQPNL